MSTSQHHPIIMKSQSSYKMFIPAEVENKIRILLNLVYNTEWSGVLFYTYEGSMENNDLVITCRDILPMNIGNSVYTEFENTPDVAGYIVDNQLFDCCQGLVHSHHSMKTFFSTTDVSTLQSEGDDTIHFVSLIVNNEGTYNAAITRKVKMHFSGTVTEEFDTFNDSKTTVTRQTSQDSTVIQYSMLEVEVQNENSSYIFERIKELKNNSKPTSTVTTTNTYTYKKLNSNVEDDDFWDYKVESIEKSDDNNINEAAKVIVGKLLSGNMTYNLSDDAMLEYNAKRVTDTFAKSFSSLNTFEYWAECFVDCILYDKTYDMECNSDSYISTLCLEVVKMLETYEKNDYISSYINILSNYIIPE